MKRIIILLLQVVVAAYMCFCMWYVCAFKEVNFCLPEIFSYVSLCVGAVSFFIVAIFFLWLLAMISQFFFKKH